MLSAKPISSRFMITTLIVAISASYAVRIHAQDSNQQPKAAFVDDWSHHHVIFSNPGTREDAVSNKGLNHWQEINNNPRYKMQQIKRNLGQRPVENDFRHEGGDWGESWNRDRGHRRDPHQPGPQTNAIEKDWSEVLGGGTSLISTVAAPTASNISGSSQINFTNGITLNILASAPTGEIATINVNNQPATGDTVVVGAITYTWNQNPSSSAPSSGCVIDANTFLPNSNYATYLRSAINAGGRGSRDYGTSGYTWNCATGVGANPAVTSSVNNTTITLTGTAVGSTAAPFTLTSSAPGNTAVAVTSAATDGTSDTTHFRYWSGNAYVTAAQLATNIAATINSNSTANAVLVATANSPASGEITFTKTHSTGTDTIGVTAFTGFTGLGSLTTGVQAAVQPNLLPAKYGASLTAADCTNDFVVYPTGQAGSPSAATIVAYNKIYIGASGCGTTDPSAYWAYNTHTSYSATTSPILSLDGTQLAFIESNGTTAELVLVKWAPSTTNSFFSPATPTLEPNAAAYQACTGGAPCMYIIPFGNGNNDSFSAPFYDFSTTNLIYDDVIYVCDNSGYLHKFKGVFRGSPAEVTTGGWPFQIGSAALSSPVYDASSGYVFVGNMTGTLYSVVGGATPSVHGSAAAGNDAIADAPLVDSTTGSVFAFASEGGPYSQTNYNAIYQFSTQFIALGSPGTVAVGSAAQAGTGYYLYDGMFDNTYFTSTNGTGNLWVVGNTGVTTGATLYQVGVSGGSLTGTVTARVTGLTPNATNAYPWPSPLTEFYNTTNAKDYVYFSVNRGYKGTCTNTAGNGCIMGYDVTAPATPTLLGTQNYTTPGTNGCWATSGIVIDNSAATTGASQIYYVGMNGTAAGGPNGATSSHCTASTGYTVNAIQAAQINP